MNTDLRPDADLIPGPGDVLLVVDVQQDFLPGGALGVPAGDRVLSPLGRVLARFAALRLPVYATRDWHPPDHCSFAAQGGPWPPHCIAGTGGAAFAPALQWPPQTIVVSKATGAAADAYSGFSGTELATMLRKGGTRRLFVGGLATDYCVLQTVLDARAEGFEVVVLDDAIAPVEVHPGDGARALARMQAAGARLAPSAALGSPGLCGA